jgi:hypothetical protein
MRVSLKTIFLVFSILNFMQMESFWYILWFVLFLYYLWNWPVLIAALVCFYGYVVLYTISHLFCWLLMNNLIISRIFIIAIVTKTVLPCVLMHNITWCTFRNKSLGNTYRSEIAVIGYGVDCLLLFILLLFHKNGGLGKTFPRFLESFVVIWLCSY